MSDKIELIMNHVVQVYEDSTKLDFIEKLLTMMTDEQLRELIHDEGIDD